MTLVVIDGFSILFRSFFAVQNLYNVNGVPIGGVVGFVRTVLKIIDNFQPEYCVIALDSGKPTWRHELYDQYKSNRKKTPDDLIPQFEIIIEACKILGISTFKGQKCEADDWIGSISQKYKTKCEKVFICSCDKDLMQLVGDNVFFLDPFKLMIMHEKDVQAKLGVLPKQIPDLFGLIGDASDCIPGVPTIGSKTASNWLQEFPDIETIFANHTQLKPKARQMKFVEHYDQAILSRTLAQLKYGLELPDIKELHYGTEEATIMNFLDKYKLANHIKKYPEIMINKKASLF